MDLTGKVAIVTGGASGIGYAVVVKLLERKSKVCIADVNESLGQEVEKKLKEKYEDVIFVPTDVSSKESFQGAFERTIKAFGKLDILINNAGIGPHNDYARTVSVNLIGPICGTELAIPYMSPKNGGNGGVIINTASLLGIKPHGAVPTYSASKCGLVGYTKAFASSKQSLEHGINMCAVCPNAVDTPLLNSGKHMFSDFQDDPLIMETLKNPMRPAFVADAFVRLIDEGKNGAIVALLSEEAGFQYVEDEQQK